MNELRTAADLDPGSRITEDDLAHACSLARMFDSDAARCLNPWRPPWRARHPPAPPALPPARALQALRAFYSAAVRPCRNRNRHGGVQQNLLQAAEMLQRIVGSDDARREQRRPRRRYARPAPVAPRARRRAGLSGPHADDAHPLISDSLATTSLRAVCALTWNLYRGLPSLTGTGTAPLYAAQIDDTALPASSSAIRTRTLYAAMSPRTTPLPVLTRRARPRIGRGRRA